MSRLINHIGSFFPKLQKDFKIYDGEVFSEVYDGDFYKDIPYSKYINYNLNLPLENAVFIRDFGAKPNDTSINNSKYINNAIEKCSNNGGGIVVVDGGNYTSGTIYLKSNVVFYIAKDSSIVASHNTDDYTDNALIYADNCENIGVVGPGKICGEGNFFSLAPHLPPKTEPFTKTLDVWDLRQEYRKRIRFPHKSKYGYLIFIKNCNRVKFYNLILENAAMWTVNVNSSNDVNVSNIVINNNRHIANTDGIDICGSSNVIIKNCFVSTADDGIALKNNMSVATSGDDGLKIKNNLDVACKRGMSNVYIHDCEVVSCTNSFKIGTETSLDISDVTVENCKFYLILGVSVMTLQSLPNRCRKIPSRQSRRKQKWTPPKSCIRLQIAPLWTNLLLSLHRLLQHRNRLHMQNLQNDIMISLETGTRMQYLTATPCRIFRVSLLTVLHIKSMGTMWNSATLPMKKKSPSSSKEKSAVRCIWFPGSTILKACPLRIIYSTARGTT